MASVSTKQPAPVLKPVVSEDVHHSGKSSTSTSVIPEASYLVWLGIVLLPVVFTYNDTFATVFPSEWYIESNDSPGPKPLGLCLGLLAVVVGQTGMILYHWLHRQHFFGKLTPIQISGAPGYVFVDGLAIHLAQPEGFVALGGYLVGTWMLNLLPKSYYSFDGGVNWPQVAFQLLIQDGVQFLMHRFEHAASPAIYKASHKPHHRFTNPKLFDAFNGSLADTFLMILVPLYVTANLVHCNVWTYMAFGSLYANWLTLIHSEYTHPWEWMFRMVGFGTAADHHVHHKLFKFNYGHLFMYWDMICGSYKDPATVVKYFNKGV
eukprot:m.207680 g.207680  ORF g.207680 m.207680 type:complete len:320 (-) comp18936_c0_seq1:1742-2701(-)